MASKISILGCGWLGFPLAQSLIKKNEVKGSTTSAHKLDQLIKNGITPFLIDLENLTQNLSEFLNSEILIIAVTPKSISVYKELILAIKQSTIQNVMFISSTSVYGNHSVEITEDFPVKESTLSIAEDLFRKEKKFNTTIIRFAGLIGYNRNPNNFFKNGKKIDNPCGVVNMIHQDDCIRIIEEIISQNTWGETFNACADTHPTRKDFYTHAYESFQLHPIEFTNTITELKQISNQKLKQVLNYEFIHPNLLKLNEMPFD